MHSLFWENIAPIFKTEAQEAFHFFTVSSANNYCDGYALWRGFKFAKWPVVYKDQLHIQQNIVPRYT